VAHMTQAEFDVERVAAYMEARPGQRLDYHLIAADLGIPVTRCGAALSYLLKHETCRGLARVGRGAYQLDPPLTPEPILGWVVLINEVKDGPPKWQPTWDGEVHTGRDLADAQLADAQLAAWQCALGEVRLATP
jgi:hypothetical protein